MMVRRKILWTKIKLKALLMINLLYQDMAMLDWEDTEWDYNPISKDKIYNKFHSFLNKASELGGKKSLSNEIRKTPKDILIIELVIESVKEYMILFGRDKTINIPLQFVHIVPKESNYENSFFGGIVVEKVEDDRVFAVNLFQKIFTRTSFSAIKVHKDRTFSYIDIGGNFKEAVASLMSRNFFEEVVSNNNLFEKDKPIIEEKCFNLEAEDFFIKSFREVMKNNRGYIPKEKLFHDTVEATINGRVLPLMILRNRKIEEKEVIILLEWFNGVGTKLS